MIGHNGGAPGINSEVWMFPREDYVAIVLSRFDPPTATRVADDIATIITGSAPPRGWRDDAHPPHAVS